MSSAIKNGASKSIWRSCSGAIRLFDHHFCRVARGNEKGVVEGLVKFTRLNFFVPVPQVRDLAPLNDQLRQRCVEDRQRRLRGQNGCKAQLLLEDQQAFLPLPASRFKACRKGSTTASSLSLVRFDRNDYSVPVQWAHHPIVVKGFCGEVVLCCGGQEIARHERIWKAEQVRFEPLHYLALLETKPGALDHARPLAGWTLPECLALLRRRLEAERDGEGTREYIRVLRLLEKHPLSRLRRRWKRDWRWGPSPAPPSPSSCIRAKTGAPHCSPRMVNPIRGRCAWRYPIWPAIASWWEVQYEQKTFGANLLKSLHGY